MTAAPLRRRPPPLPFLTTTPLQDVMLTVGGMPLWWALGVEQFVYPLLLAIPTLKVLLVDRRIVVSPLLLALSVFLTIYLASALFIVEGERYLTFAKNLSTYVTALMLVVVLPASIRRWADARALLSVLALTMTAAGLIGLLGITGLYRSTFTSPFGALLPASIAETALGKNIVERSLGWPSWFAGLGSYFRLKSVFLWPTSYAPALALTLPVVVFLAAGARRRAVRVGLTAAAGVLALNLVFTTGRMAAIALVVGVAYAFLLGRTAASWRWRLAAVALGAALVFGAAALEPTLLEVGDRVEEVVFARGSGSPTSRWTIYERTLAGAAERPWLGWGTERTIQGVSDAFIYPAGSHSYLLGTLYRQGVVGLVAFALVWWATWAATASRAVPRPRGRATVDTPEAFLAVGRAIVVSALVMSLTLAFDLDASLMLVWWLLVALFVAVRRLPGAAHAAVPEVRRS